MIDVTIVSGAHKGTVVSLSLDVFDSGYFSLDELPVATLTPCQYSKPVRFIVKSHLYKICHKTKTATEC